MNMSTNKNRLTYTCGCQGGGKNGDFGISRCKLIYRMDKQQDPTI